MENNTSIWPNGIELKFLFEKFGSFGFGIYWKSSSTFPQQFAEKINYDEWQAIISACENYCAPGRPGSDLLRQKITQDINLKCWELVIWTGLMICSMGGFGCTAHGADDTGSATFIAGMVFIGIFIILIISLFVLYSQWNLHRTALEEMAFSNISLSVTKLALRTVRASIENKNSKYDYLKLVITTGLSLPYNPPLPTSAPSSASFCTAPSSASFCTACGLQVAVNFAFCGRCGTKNANFASASNNTVNIHISKSAPDFLLPSALPTWNSDGKCANDYTSLNEEQPGLTVSQYPLPPRYEEEATARHMSAPQKDALTINKTQAFYLTATHES